jgi:signal transduction histidine kinase
LILQSKPVELDAILFEVMQEMTVIARGTVQLRMNEVDQLQVRGDPDRLKQVFLNLLGNAIQYTPSGGSVFVGLARIGDRARVIIRDTGPGIPADDLPHIFERFYRVEKSRTRSRAAGFGLGLSIANWIVESHGGQITVESREGRGTTFAVWLPTLGRSESGAADGRGDASGGDGKLEATFDSSGQNRMPKERSGSEEDSLA